MNIKEENEILKKVCDQFRDKHFIQQIPIQEITKPTENIQYSSQNSELTDITKIGNAISTSLTIESP